MTSYNTGNPIGSKDPRDLYDNAENLDEAVNTRQAESWTDRFGVARKTWWGMEQDFQQFLINSGYENIGDYAAGLEITARNQIFWRDGELYRAGAVLELPYTTTGDWAEEEGLFVAVGDAALRQELSGQFGAELIGFGDRTLQGVVQTLKSSAPVSILEFEHLVLKENPNDYTTWDWSPAMNAAHASARTVTYPIGDPYYFSGDVEISLFGSSLVGQGSELGSTQLIHTGSATAFVVRGSSNYTSVRLLTIRQDVKSEGYVFEPGTVLFDTQEYSSNLIIDDCFLVGFETIALSNYNSYYNTVRNSRLDSFKTGFKNYSANNFNVSKCMVVTFEDFLTLDSGGPVNIKDCSIEVINGSIISGPFSPGPSINFEGNYVETYNNVDLPLGFTQRSHAKPGKFGATQLFSGTARSVYSVGNSMQVPGASSVYYFVSEIESIISENILFDYPHGSAMSVYASLQGDVKYARMEDRLIKFEQAGEYDVSRFPSTIPRDKLSHTSVVYDPYEGKYMQRMWYEVSFAPPFLSEVSYSQNAYKLDASGNLIIACIVTASSSPSLGDNVFQVRALSRPQSPSSLPSFDFMSSSASGVAARFRYMYDTGHVQYISGAVSNTFINVIIPGS